MPINRVDVVNAYVSVLRGISGAPYNLNIGGRVVQRLIGLDQLSDGQFPFVMVLDEPTEVQLNPDTHIYTENIRLWVYGIVRESSSDPLVTTAVSDVYRLRDDIVKITDANRNLGVSGVGIPLCNSWRPWTGVDPTYAACRVTVAIPWNFSPADLGQ